MIKGQDIPEKIELISKLAKSEEAPTEEINFLNFEMLKPLSDTDVFLLLILVHQKTNLLQISQFLIERLQQYQISEETYKDDFIDQSLKLISIVSKYLLK